MTTVWPYPRLIAHRGAGKIAPENTLAAMRCGADHGFRMFEFDVKLSKDNHLILLHDDKVNRTSNGKGKAADKTLAQLLELDFGGWHSAYYAGEPITTLAAVARFTQENHIFCNIEIKPCPSREEETGTAVALAVRKLWHKNVEPVLLSSFDMDALRAAKKAAPEIARAALYDKLPKNYQKLLAELECVAVNIDEKAITKKIIQDLHALDVRVCAWTVNDYRRALELLQWGCDGIITDELVRISPNSPAFVNYV